MAKTKKEQPFLVGHHTGTKFALDIIYRSLGFENQTVEGCALSVAKYRMSPGSYRKFNAVVRGKV